MMIIISKIRYTALQWISSNHGWYLYLVFGIIAINLCSSTSFAQKKKKKSSSQVKYAAYPDSTSKLLDSLFKELPQKYQIILKNPEKYRFQLIYTQISRSNKNTPKLKHHVYRLDTTEYFYPASCLKMPVAALALEKLKHLSKSIPDLSWDTQIINLKSRPCQMDPVKTDPDMQSKTPTIKGYIKKIFLISDNPGYDRLFEFLTPYFINDTLRKRGYHTTRIIQRLFTYCPIEEHKYISPIQFYQKGKLIYEQKESVCDSLYALPHVKKDKIGKYSWSAAGKVSGGLDPSKYSYIALKDLHDMLIALVMPNASNFPPQKRFNLSNEEYHLIRKYMSMHPSESKDPDLSDKRFQYYENGRMKYFIYGGQGKDTIPNLRIFNKVGMAVGFLTDVAYIVDFKHQCEFFLSATIYVNENETIGDDKYEYYSIGLPFLKEIGKIILKYEQNRPRKYKPNLSEYIFDYSQP